MGEDGIEEDSFGLASEQRVESSAQQQVSNEYDPTTGSVRIHEIVQHPGPGFQMRFPTAKRAMRALIDGREDDKGQCTQRQPRLFDLWLPRTLKLARVAMAATTPDVSPVPASAANLHHWPMCRLNPPAQQMSRQRSHFAWPVMCVMVRPRPGALPSSHNKRGGLTFISSGRMAGPR